MKQLKERQKEEPSNPFNAKKMKEKKESKKDEKEPQQWHPEIPDCLGTFVKCCKPGLAKKQNQQATSTSSSSY
jgi:hypothetical protein